MIFRVGIENNNEGYRSIAWALEHPGCFAYGKDGDSALAALPAAWRAYAEWIARHEPVWLDASTVEPHVEDTWSDYFINEAFDRDPQSDYYMVDAWFQHDWKPLTEQDIERGLKLLAWSWEDLLATVENLTPEQWAYKKEGERWDIAGIVRHIGGAEWWYLDRLGLAFPREDVPKEPLERLAKVRARVVEVLPALEGKNQVAGVDGEFWSPRKMLRRAVWHERDHTEHIRKLIVV
jgi:hypothetical protein